MITSLVTVVHVFVCILLVLIVLLQHGKGADMGASFGGGSQTLFGAAGADNLLTRITTALAAIFMVTSVILASHANAKRAENSGNIFQNAPSEVPAAGSAPTPAGSTPAGSNGAGSNGAASDAAKENVQPKAADEVPSAPAAAAPVAAAPAAPAAPANPAAAGPTASPASSPAAAAAPAAGAGAGAAKPVGKGSTK